MRLYCLCLLLAAVSPCAAAVQDYPVRPIRMIVASSPGSGVDIVSRLVAQRMSEPLGVQVVVDNRAGAGGAIGVQLTEVPFSGTGPAMNALLGGQVDVLCDQTTQTVPQIKAGNVKLYGVTTKNRVKVLPQAPTLHEQGLKDFEVVVWHGIYAPKGTPKAIVEGMNKAVRAALKDPDVVKRMDDLGAEIVPGAGNTPQALQAHLDAEIAKWGPVIRAGGKFAD